MTRSFRAQVNERIAKVVVVEANDEQEAIEKILFQNDYEVLEDLQSSLLDDEETVEILGETGDFDE
jgi:hypothetical protein